MGLLEGTYFFAIIFNFSDWICGVRKCYRHIDTYGLDYTAAAQTCSELNAYLAAPQSKEENREIQRLMISGGGTRVWLGLQRNGDGFELPNGTPAVYDNWNTGMLWSV